MEREIITTIYKNGTEVRSLNRRTFLEKTDDGVFSFEMRTINGETIKGKGSKIGSCRSVISNKGILHTRIKLSKETLSDMIFLANRQIEEIEKETKPKTK